MAGWKGQQRWEREEEHRRRQGSERRWRLRRRRRWRQRHGWARAVYVVRALSFLWARVGAVVHHDEGKEVECVTFNGVCHA